MSSHDLPKNMLLMLGLNFQHFFVSSWWFWLDNKSMQCIFLWLQAGSPHLGMDFNQVGSSKQTDMGSNWRPGLPENTIGQLSGPPAFAGQAGPSNQPPRQPPVIILHFYIFFSFISIFLSWSQGNKGMDFSLGLIIQSLWLCSWLLSWKRHYCSKLWVSLQNRSICFLPNRGIKFFSCSKCFVNEKCVANAASISSEAVYNFSHSIADSFWNDPFCDLLFFWLAMCLSIA